MATVTVTTLADSLATNGQVSLREALQAANTDMSVDGSAAGSGADTIVFAAGLNGDVDLVDVTADTVPDQLVITSNVTVSGGGRITLDGQGATRVLRIDGPDDPAPNIAVTLQRPGDHRRAHDGKV